MILVLEQACEMKFAEFDIDSEGTKISIPYDENAPCKMCGLPVIEASMGGVDLCPSCDCGNYRDGTKFTYKEIMNTELINGKAKEHV